MTDNDELVASSFRAKFLFQIYFLAAGGWALAGGGAESD